MKKILTTLVLLAVFSAGAYYFLIYKNQDYASKLSVSGFLSKLNLLENSGIYKKSEELNKGAQDFKTKAGDIIAGFSKTIGNTMEKVSSTVTSINTEVETNKLIKMISVLNGDKVSGSEVSLSVSSTAQEVAVCANVGLNQPITYLIEDPFYSISASSTYYIDWGDGGSDKRMFTTSTAQVSHIYVSSGEFITKFKVENGKSFAEVSRRVCIK